MNWLKLIRLEICIKLRDIIDLISKVWLQGCKSLRALWVVPRVNLSWPEQFYKVYIFIANAVVCKQFQTNWSRIFRQSDQARFILKLDNDCQKCSKSAKNEANLSLKSERFSIWNFAHAKNFLQPCVIDSNSNIPRAE